MVLAPRTKQKMTFPRATEAMMHSPYLCVGACIRPPIRPSSKLRPVVASPGNLLTVIGVSFDTGSSP